MQEWEKVYTKCVKLKLLKVDGNQSLKNFLYAVKSILISWLEYQKNKLQNYKLGGKKLPTFFNLVERYQNHYHTKLIQKGKTLQGAFTATFKNKPSKLLTILKLKPEPSANKKKKEG